VTYCDVDKLSTPCDEILFFGDMGIRHQLHEIENGDLGFAEEGSHYDERWYVIVG
jgi:hypothetical protein